MVVFVHGCFWHRHPDCRWAKLPKSRVRFWKDKFDRNVARDKKVAEELAALGWTVWVVWECETKDKDSLTRGIRTLFDLGPTGDDAK